jgi:excisionase family DNA binding protein
MKLSAGQAAKEANVSVPTVTRAIKDGRMSAERTDDGKGYLIDQSELSRVFPPGLRHCNAATNMLERETHNDISGLQIEVAILREKLSLLETYSDREREQLTRQADGLRQQAEHWRMQAERVTLRLPAPATDTRTLPPAEAQERSSIWSRLSGRGKLDVKRAV